MNLFIEMHLCQIGLSGSQPRKQMLQSRWTKKTVTYENHEFYSIIPYYNYFVIKMNKQYCL